MEKQDLILKARKSNLVDYLKGQGYTFKREGNRYRCIEHKSLVITNGNAYYWNSKQSHGNSIDFLMNHMNMNFNESLEALTNNSIPLKYDDFNNKKYSSQAETEKSINYIVTKQYLNRAFAYLNQQRLIDSVIIANLIDKNYIKMITGTNYKYPVIGFAVLDQHKNILGYEIQGTFDKVKFKGITNDLIDTNLGFNISIGKPKKAYFFESAIDLLSFYQLWKHNKIKVDISNSLLVSMAGLKINTIITTLESFSIEAEPFLCIDTDMAAKAFKEALNNQGIKFNAIDIPQDNIKDWNDYLKEI